ncbi:rngB, partial [Symbiodinium pilosum]
FDLPDADFLADMMHPKVAQVVAVNRCVSSVYAYYSRTDGQSMRAAETHIGQEHMRTSESHGVSVTVKKYVARESRMHADEWVVLKTAKASTVDEFLRSPWYKRVFVLVRAMHPWITMQYVSLFRSHAVRAALIILKLVSAGAVNALFFISTSTTPDSDSACAPPQNFGERMLRAAIV